MEKLRKYIEQPVSHNDLMKPPTHIEFIHKSPRSETNDEAILNFYTSFQLNVPHIEEKREINNEITRATRLEKSIILKKLEGSIIPMKYEEGELELKVPSVSRKKRKKDNEIVLSDYRNSIANAGLPSFEKIPLDARHDDLDMYYFYDNQDDRPNPSKSMIKQLYYSKNKPQFYADILKKFNTYFKFIQSKHPENPHVYEKNLETGFQPFIHQYLIRQYLNNATPYRGILLYHGLGSGKTCTSIGLIEAMKETLPQIYILTPASLKQNYITQMKKCGSSVFSNVPYNHHHWRFVEYPKDEKEKTEFIRQVKVMTKLPDKYLLNKKRRGIYMRRYGFGSESNDDTYEINESVLEEQIQLMIEHRFKFISYNGISSKAWNMEFKKGRKHHNPFHHSVVIIDEGHNFVSRIVNKINAKKESVSTMIYRDLVDAENCKVVVLSGTPLINYPCELGVMFNIINGANRIITLEIKNSTLSKMNISHLKTILKTITTIDYLEFEKSKSKNGYGILKILRNPYGFKKVQGSMIMQDVTSSTIMTEELMEKIKERLLKDGFTFKKSEKEDYEIQSYDSFPDNEVEFNEKFVSNNKLKNAVYFQQKILGSVSYIGDNKEEMPRVIVPQTLPDKEWYKGEDIFIEEVMMTPYVLEGYDVARDIERGMDKKMNTKKGGKDTHTSSYKLFSRSASNFVFPDKFKMKDRGIGLARPFPNKVSQLREEDLELMTDTEKLELVDGTYDKTDIEQQKEVSSAYQKKILTILQEFTNHPEEYFESDLEKRATNLRIPQPMQSATNQLTMYSPKFHRILQNVMEHSDDYGVQLLYSNFRTLEGIGIFKIILDYYGFTEFRIKKTKDGYALHIQNPYYKDASSFSALKSRKFYALYTGTEDSETKEIIRNIYNGNMDAITDISLKEELQTIFNNGKPFEPNKANLKGQLIELLMITSSGAEGIDLKNVRYVHIMEPYWHAVRISQVIGRGRRIKSHEYLPEEYQDIKVYMYVLIHNKDLLKENQDKYRKLIEGDSDKGLRKQYVYSTDESLYRIMYRKKKLMDEFLSVLKESSIDCTMNYEGKEKDAKCFKPKKVSKKQNPEESLYHFDYKEDKTTTFRPKKVNTYENSNDE